MMTLLKEILERNDELKTLLPVCNHSCMLPHEDGSEECASCGMVKLSAEAIEAVKFDHLMGDADDADLDDTDD